MKGFTRSDLLFSLCGLNCGLCPMQIGGYCPGCGGGEGNQSCRIARCSLTQGKPEYCSLCQEFPCGNYGDIDEFDSFITHVPRRRDLQKRDEIGTERYQKEQTEKRQILEWLLESYDDGRKKSFYCLAVNLLELEDLRDLKGEISLDAEMNSLSLKEKAAWVKRRLEEKAGERQIVLRLRRKKR